MATEHTVKQGECFASLAEQHGFSDYRKLYNHPRNAAIKSKRPNPNVLFPGDIVHIPEKRGKHEVCTTGQSHTFQVRSRPPVPLRIVIQNSEGMPQSGAAYVLTIGGKTFHGKTDGRGLVEHDIDPNARQGELTIQIGTQATEGEAPAQDEMVIPLAIGHLDPVETVSGIRRGLTTLAFPAAASQTPGTKTHRARCSGFSGNTACPSRASLAQRFKRNCARSTGHNNASAHSGQRFCRQG